MYPAFTSMGSSSRMSRSHEISSSDDRPRGCRNSVAELRTGNETRVASGNGVGRASGVYTPLPAGVATLFISSGTRVWIGDKRPELLANGDEMSSLTMSPLTTWSAIRWTAFDGAFSAVSSALNFSTSSCPMPWSLTVASIMS